MQIFLYKNNIQVGECELELKTHIISKLKIYEDFRCKGFCSELIKKVIKIAKEKKFKNLILYVKSWNTSAIKCYKKNNFKTIKILYKKKDNSIGGYKMELKIEKK